MNDIPQAEGTLLGFVLFASVILAFVAYKFRDKIISKYKEWKTKK